VKSLAQYGARNLLRRPRRTLLTLLAVAVGAGGSVFTFSYLNRVERYLRVVQIYLLHTGHLTIYKQPGYEMAQIRPSGAAFEPAEQRVLSQVLEAESAVQRHTSFLIGAGMMSNGCTAMPFQALGLDPAHLQKAYADPDLQEEAAELVQMAAGRPLWEALQAATPIMVTPGLAELLDKPHVRGTAPQQEPAFIDCTDPASTARIREDAWVQLLGHRWDGQFTAVDAEIVARFRTGFAEYENTLALLPLQMLQGFYGTDAITYKAVFLKDRDQVEAVVQRLQAAFEARGLPVAIYPWWSPITSPNYTFNVPLTTVMANFILAILLIMVSLSLANAMTLSLLERLRELGTLRALGFTPRGVLYIVLTEALLLTVMGTALGLAGGLSLGALVNAANLRYSPPAFAGTLQFMVHPTGGHVFVSAMLVFVVSLFATLIAARRQLRKRVVVLLQG
jgi:putative ABC transport system permease protein